MRWSQALIPTLKESPADAVAPSHVLLLRAGMIRQLGAGAYTYLPLGLPGLEQGDRDRPPGDGRRRRAGTADARPAPGRASGRSPAGTATWAESSWNSTVGGNTPAVLGPTHEEVVTDAVRDLVRSYKQLPMTLYQIQTKFRDEPRPRFGIIRTREFLMKDAYSFDADLAQLNESYDAMYEAYCRVFDRCGVPYVIVEAESGPIGGDSSHEFMVPSDTGEDSVIQCTACGYAANVEKAEIGQGPAPSPFDPATPAFEKVETPNKKTIEEVCSFLKVPKRNQRQTARLLGRRQTGRGLDPRRPRSERGQGAARRSARSTLEPADAGGDPQSHRRADGLSGADRHQDSDGGRLGRRRVENRRGRRQ